MGGTFEQRQLQVFKENQNKINVDTRKLSNGVGQSAFLKY
jgi:hypothetical protein